MDKLLLISHSKNLAKATKQFCEKILPVNHNLIIEYIAGDDSNNFGNSFDKINKKLSETKQDKTYIIYDLGSAKIIVDLVLSSLKNPNLHLINCSFVEGSLIAYSSINKNSNPKKIIEVIEKQAIKIS